MKGSCILFTSFLYIPNIKFKQTHLYTLVNLMGDRQNQLNGSFGATITYPQHYNVEVIVKRSSHIRCFYIEMQ